MMHCDIGSKGHSVDCPLWVQPVDVDTFFN